MMGIFTLLIATLAPAIQQCRESARRTQCLTRVGQIALAVQSYESSRRCFPSGTLGNEKTLPFEDNYFNEQSPGYWKRFQFTSGLAMIFPYLENSNALRDLHFLAFDIEHTLDDSLDATGNREFDSMLSLPGARPLAETQPSSFLYPSDDASSVDPPMITAGIQPVRYIPGQHGALAWINLYDESIESRFGISNYAACLGSGRMSPPSEGRGLMGCRTRIRASQAKDGLSKTVLLGETLGSIQSESKERLALTSWYWGAVARGRPGRFFDASLGSFGPEDPFLGNREAAGLLTFSAVHSDGIVFGFGDGHCALVDREIERDLFYASCDIADGDVR